MRILADIKEGVNRVDQMVRRNADMAEARHRYYCDESYVLCVKSRKGG